MAERDRINVKVDPAVARGARAVAATKGVPFGSVVEEALRKALDPYQALLVGMAVKANIDVNQPPPSEQNPPRERLLKANDPLPGLKRS
jgi:hypothetical protein